ncbi:hypothetical protein [Streptomyces sp. NBC_00847]|uniref:hypothetical protein n=1 Tax=Streptomyces sp. NBC_00847 TaxID=2975850 RepID=UPI00225DED5E|nr:hypothetical protein [Streptomyces sp. NBC_00847]MCX4885940.1 hypothetical protein [Streptomyces sp. NBC_00847]
MTTMTLTPADLGDEQEPTSYDQGRLDGQLAAVDRLTSRRAHARAAMAAPYDQAYADGYLDGFDYQTDINARIRFHRLLGAFHNGPTVSGR